MQSKLALRIVERGEISPFHSLNTKHSEANVRSSQVDEAGPLGPKEDLLRLTEDHQARTIQIDKGLSQIDKGLIQAILSQMQPHKVGKGQRAMPGNTWPSQVPYRPRKGSTRQAQGSPGRTQGSPGSTQDLPRPIQSFLAKQDPRMSSKGLFKAT